MVVCDKGQQVDISELNSKRRYAIKKGIERFDVRRINPMEYKEQIYQIKKAAYSDYPQKYRPSVNRDKVFKEIEDLDCFRFYGAFSIEAKEMAGYALLYRNGREINYSEHKVMPKYEKYRINAAIVNHILLDNEQLLNGTCYINDGSRNILHETAFHDYLEKYFGFRKAYCKLNIKYRFPFNIIVRLIYPFRKLINSDGKLGCRTLAVLKMEEYRRKTK